VLNNMLIRMLVALFIISAQAKPASSQQPMRAVASDVKIVNQSGSNVYWHFQQDNAFVISGLLKSQKSSNIVNVSFFPNQAVTIQFNCNKADTWTCAEGKVDVTKFYPSNQHDNIVTVFTYNNQGVVLSFEASSIDDKHGPKQIVIGPINTDAQ